VTAPRRPGSAHPSAEDPVVASLSEVVGGPVGTRVRGRTGRPGEDSWWSPLRVLLALTALTLGLGVVASASCASDQFRGEGQLAAVCSSQVADAYTGAGLAELAWPWSDDEVVRDRHPVLTEPALVGAWSYAAAVGTHVLAGLPDLDQRRAEPAADLPRDSDVRRERVIFVGVNALGFAVLALLTTAALSRVHRRRPWDAAGFALAPLLVVTGLDAWDLLAVSAVALAVLAWSRGRPAAAGAAVGLGVAAGVWPVLLLAAFALGSAGARRGRDVAAAAGAAALAWGLVVAPALLSGPAQWRRSWEAALDRAPDSGTVWTVLDATVGLSDTTVQSLSWVLLALWAAGVVALSVLAPVRPRVSQAALLLVAGLLLLRPSFEPHQALWLLPLAVLARPRWRDLLVWQGCAVVFAALHSWWLAGLLAPGGDGPAGFYWLAIGVHVVGTLWLVAVVARDVWHPRADPVVEERPWPEEPPAPQVTTTRSNDVAV
jgi:hypothetical protein